MYNICYGLDISSTDYENEQTIFFNFHLENVTDNIKIKNIINKLIYNNFGDIYDYIEYKKNEFYATYLNDFGISYEENISVKHDDDLFLIVYKSGSVHYGDTGYSKYIEEYYIIDLIDEKIMGWNELIQEIPENELKKLILSSESDLDVNIWDYCELESIWPPGTFGFEKEGVLLCWKPYSWPITNAPVYISIEYDLIEKYLTKKGKELMENIIK
jgi:hypothetical protein